MIYARMTTVYKRQSGWTSDKSRPSASLPCHRGPPDRYLPPTTSLHWQLVGFATISTITLSSDDEILTINSPTAIEMETDRVSPACEGHENKTVRTLGIQNLILARCSSFKSGLTVIMSLVSSLSSLSPNLILSIATTALWPTSSLSLNHAGTKKLNDDVYQNIQGKILISTNKIIAFHCLIVTNTINISPMII